MNSVTISVMTESGDYKNFDVVVLPGGEPHPQIKGFDFNKDQSVTVFGQTNSSSSFLATVAFVMALKNLGYCNIVLALPYFPGARQDRISAPGECLTVKMYADIVNSLNLRKVIILDPHSHVTPALINKVHVINQHEFIHSLIWCHTFDGLIVPDEGALKKSLKIAQELNITDIIFCQKVRDYATGEILGLKADRPYSPDRNYLVCDDICDGGRTFLELADKFKGAKMSLAVTHGIFSSPTNYKKLTQAYQHIFTTDSFRPDLVQTKKLSVLNCVEIIL